MEHIRLGRARSQPSRRRGPRRKGQFIFGVLACGAIPITLVFMSKHFKLRTRELELEAELHARHSQARLQAMETRLSAMEGALGSLLQAISRRQDLMQHLDAPQAAEMVRG